MATTTTPTTPPAGTYTGPMPDAAAFGMYQAQMNQAYQNTLARIQQQRGQFLQQSGLVGHYDANGNIQDYSVNPNDPFGSYQQMLKGNAQTADAVDAASHGVGFTGSSGIVHQQQDAVHENAAANASQWGQGIVQGLGDLSNQQQMATDDYNNNLYGQMLQEVQTAIANGTFNPGGAGDLSGGPFAPPPAKKALPAGAIGTINGKPVYGYGKEGTPFFSKGQAIIHGRLGKGKGK